MDREITVADIMAHHPCSAWSEERVRAAIGGDRVRGRAHARRVLLALRPPDARWILSRLLRAGDVSHVAWAADCAEHVLHRLADEDEHDEAHATAAIQAARRWGVERSYAAAYAARAAAYAAAAAAAAYAAAYAARAAAAAAAAAAYAAAYAARAAAAAAADDAAAYAAAYAARAAASADVAYLGEHEWQVDRALDYLYGGE